MQPTQIKFIANGDNNIACVLWQYMWDVCIVYRLQISYNQRVILSFYLLFYYISPSPIKSTATKSAFEFRLWYGVTAARRKKTTIKEIKRRREIPNQKVIHEIDDTLVVVSILCPTNYIQNIRNGILFILLFIFDEAFNIT